MSFILNLLGVKTDQAVNGLISTIVEWDPQSATEAELRAMEENLDALSQQVSQARMAFEREHKEAQTIQTLANQRMAAAEQIQTQLQATTDPGRQAELERSLATLVGLLEEMAPDVAREKQDAADAQEFLNMLQQTYQNAGAKLRSARSDLERARRDMGRAEQQRDMAEQRAESARQAAGLTGATSGLTVALKAMQDAAQRNLAAAEAANAKARLLVPSNPETSDPNIALAMARVRGKVQLEHTAVPTPGQDVLSARLDSLKQRQIGVG
jgi:chromosome segregation ATPase